MDDIPLTCAGLSGHLHRMTAGRYAKVHRKGVGPLWVAATPSGICRIAFGGSRRAFLASLPSGVNWREVGRLGTAGRADLRGGTPFQRRVWRAIAKIPRGETRSYAWLARRAGRPKAVRAAAGACGANPVPILIPCHRVIASDGTIGGFSGGLALKRRLLAREGLRL